MKKIILIIVLLIIYFVNNNRSNCRCKATEPYLNDRPNDVVDARYLARQDQGGSIDRGSHYGELDLQHGLY